MYSLSQVCTITACTQNETSLLQHEHVLQALSVL